METSNGRSFADLFGRPAEVTARAPGRVNLIGEHTDYNGGFVLPVAIPQTARAELSQRADATVRAWSTSIASLAAPEEYRIGEERRGRGWLDYVQGVTYALRTSGLSPGGFDLRLDSEVPLGSGLSSSAAIEVAMLRALREAFGFALDDVAVARLAHRAETELVGAPVGVMDPMASSLAGEGAALFLDTLTMRYEQVPLPPEAELVVIDSGVSHRHAGGEYRTRRAECERACALLAIEQLRDLSLGDLPRVARLPSPLDRRVRHVVTENARVLAAVDALRGADLARLGPLLCDSHASMRDDYAVSTPEVDALVALTCAAPGVWGARLTGGGFGGSIVALVRRGAGAAVAAQVAANYNARGVAQATVLVPRPAAYRTT